ncbi:unnamed protein product [Clonostachys byssicola]|uniref:BTB domain-containing protein n=1 Tax=Clonostachys byssicola TaxID=160290 RepID=A0A9N9UNA3_9HYPO|nr:unnamed protein product [Clonostachys byssicola]
MAFNFGATTPNTSAPVGYPKTTTNEQVKELVISLERLFTTEAYSDLTILCGGSQYKVHKALVCPRSSFFEAACRSNFKEAETGEISLPDDDPVAVEMMIRYFYFLDYTPPETKPASHPTPTYFNIEGHGQGAIFGRATYSSATKNFIVDKNFIGDKDKPKAETTAFFTTNMAPSHLVLHAQVYALAEKYDVSGLKALAATKFKCEVDIHWNSEDFMLALKEVYNSTVDHDRMLRDIVVQAVSLHLQLLESKPFQDAIKGLDFSYDLLIKLKMGGRI